MLALDRALRWGLRVARLLTLYDEASGRVRFHGMPADVMRAQAEVLGLPVSLYPTTPLHCLWGIGEARRLRYY